MREELDESTGRRQMTIIEDREKKLHPTIQILSKTKKREKIREFIIPVGAQLTVRDAQEVNPGDTVAKISREVYKTRDITGGLPRVAELFEARRPKDPAVITEIDGAVSFGEIKRGKREILVTPETGPARAYEVMNVASASRYVQAMPQLLERKFGSPTFSLGLASKDLRLAVQLGHEAGIALPITLSE